jgi:predicted nucleic acid-binding protein
MIIRWLFDERAHPLAERYRALIDRRPIVLAFQTVMELRFGALHGGWGEFRRRRLEQRIAELTVALPDDNTITVCATLRHACREAGHALAEKIHNGDRWIAATAIGLGVPLVSHDGIFAEAPNLEFLTATPKI